MVSEEREEEMKRLIPVIILISSLFLLGAGSKISIGSGSPFGFTRTTYANSRVDTLIFMRPAGLGSLSFSAHWMDSVSVTNVILRRAADGELIPVQTGDTLTAFTAFSNFTAGFQGSTADPSGSALNTVTTTPVPTSFVFIITYAASNNGVTNPKVYYQTNWQRTY